MEIGGIDKIYERIQVDKRQAQRENLKMRTVTQEAIDQQNQQWMALQQEQMQQPNPEDGSTPTPNPNPTIDPNTGMQLVPPLLVPVNTWDNHEVHIQVHNDYRKSQYYDSMDSTVRAIFEEHVKQHMEASANMMIHPLSGMDPSDPNAPDPSTEQNTLNDMEAQSKEDSSGGQTGPVPMPSGTSEDTSTMGG
jgi:hypothetical protein